MAKYSYITDKTHNNRKIQVESAKRDGSGKNIENNYAKQNGNYQSFTAGLSNNFDTKKVMVDESAYNFRPTATMGSVELEVGSPCKVKKIIGGTIVFNQLCYNTQTSVTIQAGRYSNISFTKVNGYHSVLSVVGFTLSGGSPTDLVFNIVGRDNNGYHKELQKGITSTKCSIVGYINNYDASGVYIRIQNNGENAVTLSNINANLIDLTKMFGSTIADYIYSLEQANAGSGVAWFKRYFPKEYYAYNGGELVSVKTQGKKITHFNQWDEEWELAQVGGRNVITSKNLIKALPSTIYHINTSLVYNIKCYDIGGNEIGNAVFDYGTTPLYNFTTLPNTAFIKFWLGYDYGTTYNHDICINFHYDGERDGEYEPYNSETYACDDIELRGIPQLDEGNNLAFDGDEYSNDGNVTRKYGVVDLGTLTWSKWGTQVFGTGDTQGLVKTPATTSDMPNAICSKLRVGTYYTTITDRSAGYGIAISSAGQFAIYSETDYADGNAIKTAMSGVYLIYELATPTDENSIPFTEVQECDNWGTEEWLAPTTDTRPCEVPVGHETDYLPDLKAKVEVAPNTPNENGVYVMEHNASGNIYTLIGAWLSDNGYVKPTSISGYDSTKTQTLKNVEGTLTWVDDE